jgi:hypothetical protein
MIIAVRLWLSGVQAYLIEMNSREHASLLALTSACIGGAVYLLCMMKFKLFSEKEWESLSHSVSIVKKITSRFKKGDHK